MRIAIFGGTAFIGWHLSRHLGSRGHELLLVHRGKTEPEGLPDAEHLHVERSELAGAAADVAAFRPDVVVDCLAMSREGAEAGLAAIPEGARAVMWSSVDVYRGYTAMMRETCTDAVPFFEDSPVREERYPYADQGHTTYEKLDAEEAYLARGGTVLRLSMIYGPRDYQRREEFVLRRLRAGRDRIPIGSGGFVTSRCFAPDVAELTRLVCEREDVGGEVFNACERAAWPMAALAREIVDAAGSDAELVRVPDDRLPPDMGMTGAIAQHLLASSDKARTVLGWSHTDPREALRETVRWHLDNPPPQSDPDFSADDEALAAVAG
ncbi:MAG TPA: NAD-dependent epimerase/dehydratase family protein [Actinomycetota bacterium]|nr:NAD-dependent epimerase/dehydratase family protein [Actinomycetota bacterium]